MCFISLDFMIKMLDCTHVTIDSGVCAFLCIAINIRDVSMSLLIDKIDKVYLHVRRFEHFVPIIHTSTAHRGRCPENLMS